MGRRLKSRKNLLLIGSKHAHLLIQERRIPALLRGDASEQPCEVICAIIMPLSSMKKLGLREVMCTEGKWI